MAVHYLRYKQSVKDIINKLKLDALMGIEFIY